MRKWCLVSLLVLLAGCSVPSGVQSDTAYMSLSEKQFQKTIMPHIDEELYLVQDELELAKLIQMQYEQGRDQIVYTSQIELDLYQVNDYLSHVNPFDIKFITQRRTWTDEKNVYTYYELAFTNMDSFYEDTLEYAKQNIERIVMGCTTVHDQIQAIHDYLISDVTYDRTQLYQKDSMSNSFLAYGALFEKEAVCAGYARAFMIYARLLDIPCLFVTSETIDHAWNMVYDGVDWIYVDVTWDDGDDGLLRSDYVNKKNEDFFLDGKHVMDMNEKDDFYRAVAYEFFGY